MTDILNALVLMQVAAYIQVYNPVFRGVDFRVAGGVLAVTMGYVFNPNLQPRRRLP